MKNYVTLEMSLNTSISALSALLEVLHPLTIMITPVGLNGQSSIRKREILIRRLQTLEFLLSDVSQAISTAKTVLWQVVSHLVQNKQCPKILRLKFHKNGADSERAMCVISYVMYGLHHPQTLELTRIVWLPAATSNHTLDTWPSIRNNQEKCFRFL